MKAFTLIVALVLLGLAVVLNLSRQENKRETVMTGLVSNSAEELSTKHPGVEINARLNEDDYKYSPLDAGFSYNPFRHEDYKRHFHVIREHWKNSTNKNYRTYSIVRIIDKKISDLTSLRKKINMLPDSLKKIYINNIISRARKYYTNSMHGKGEEVIWQLEYYKDHIDEFIDKYFRLGEIGWIRDEGNDVFLLGVTHDFINTYLHRQFYSELCKNIDFLAIERISSDNFLDDPLGKTYHNESDFGYGEVMRVCSRNNRSLIFIQADVRNKIDYHFDKHRQSDGFYDAYFDFIKRKENKKLLNAFSQTITNPSSLRLLVEMYNTENRLKHSYTYKDDVGFVNQLAHFVPDPVNRRFLAVPLYSPYRNGRVELTDAIIAHHIVNFSGAISGKNDYPADVIDFINKNEKFRDELKRHRKEGAIIFIMQGNAHIPQINLYLRNEDERERVIALHPHYFGSEEGFDGID